MHGSLLDRDGNNGRNGVGPLTPSTSQLHSPFSCISICRFFFLVSGIVFPFKSSFFLFAPYA